MLWCKLAQRVELDRIQLGGHDDDEINIADAASEVAGDQRAVEIDADELIAQDGSQSAGQLRAGWGGQFRLWRVNDRCMGHGSIRCAISREQVCLYWIIRAVTIAMIFLIPTPSPGPFPSKHKERGAIAWRNRNCLEVSVTVHPNLFVGTALFAGTSDRQMI